MAAGNLVSPALNSVAPPLQFSAWLDQRVASFHSSPGFRSQPGSTLLTKLKAQSDLAVGAARIFFQGLSGGTLGSIANQLVLCADTVSQLDLELTRSLSAILITPIDGEDIQRLSNHMARIVRAESRAGAMVALAPENSHSYVAVQTGVVSASEALAEAICLLGQRKSVSASEQRIKACRADAKREVRILREQAMVRVSDPLSAIQQMAVTRLFEEILVELKDSRSLLVAASLKNG